MQGTQPTQAAQRPQGPQPQVGAGPQRITPPTVGAGPQWGTPPFWTPPPRPPSVLATRWPGPTGAADRAVIGGALLTGLVAAISVPLDRSGAGWVAAGAMAIGCVAINARNVRNPVSRLGWTAATVLLLGAGAVRAAGWLFILCLLTTAITWSLAAAGGRGPRGLLAGAFAWPVAAVRALPWTVRGALRLGGTDLRVGATVGVTLLLVLVFGALFASADAVFARAISAVTPELDLGTVIRSVFLLVSGTLIVIGSAYLVSRPPNLDWQGRPGTGRLRAFEWGLPVAALDLLFGAFVAVQFTVLFGGKEHVLGPDGPNYASYARGGFWQLLLVTLLTLVVLGTAARWARRDGVRDRVLIRVLLGTLAALALVVVASALYRMHVYEQAYGFTRLRVLVSACELWLGGLFALVLLAGVRMRAGWLPQAALGTAVAALIGLVALNPDRFIAERNIERYEDSGAIDVEYLSTLSADAVPALDRLPKSLRSCVLYQIANDLSDEPDGWREANLGRARAREILRTDPVDPSLTAYTHHSICS